MPGISEISYNNLKPVSDVSSSNVSGEGYSYLSSLKNGDTFSAKVVSTNGSDVTLRLPGGAMVNARLSSDMNISEGQTVSFELKSSGSSISISPLLTNTATDPSVLKALDQASIPVTDSTVGMTVEMMKAGLSIDKNSLLKMYENVRTYPEANVSDMADLTKLGLKVDADNLKNIENYKNLSYQIDQGMKDIAEKTDQALMSLVRNGDTGNAAKLMDTILDIALSEDGPEAPEDLKAVISQDTVLDVPVSDERAAGDETLKADVSADKNIITEEFVGSASEAESSPGISGVVKDDEIIQDPAARALQLLKALQDNPEDAKTAAKTGAASNDPVLNPADNSSVVQSQTSNAPALTTEEAFKLALEEYRSVSGDSEYVPSDTGDLLNKLSEFVKTNINGGDAEKLKNLLSDDGVRKLVFDAVKDKWSISPSEVADKDKVESLYRRLSSQIKLISEGLASAGAQNTPAYNAASNMSSNIDFLQQLNQMYAYIQLPLKLSGGDNAHGDLYVYSNKRSLSDDDSNVTAFLHLDMDNLGPVDVFVSMDVKAGGKVSTRFTVADDETLDFLSDHMDILNERLRKRGYELNCTMGVKGDDPDPEEEALDKGGVNLLLLHAGSGIGLGSSGMRSFDVRA